jgi:hypothetical protein
MPGSLAGREPENLVGLYPSLGGGWNEQSVISLKLKLKHEKTIWNFTSCNPDLSVSWPFAGANKYIYCCP